MSNTGLAVVERARQLATAGFSVLEPTDEQRTVIFKNIAPACKTKEDQMQFLATCAAAGLNPLLRELHASPSNRKVELPDGRIKYEECIVYTTSYHVFVSRCRQVGWIVFGAAVCERDVWGGWDMVENKPVKHQTCPGNRGNLIGAWARGVDQKTGLSIGNYFEFKEIAQLKSDGTATMKWRTSPQTMGEKVAVCRVAKRIVPDLAALMALEEIGEESEAPSAEPPRRNVISMAPAIEPRGASVTMQLSAAASPELKASAVRVNEALSRDAKPGDAKAQILVESTPATEVDAGEVPAGFEEDEATETANTGADENVVRPPEEYTNLAQEALMDLEAIASVKKCSISEAIVHCTPKAKGQPAEKLAQNLTAASHRRMPSQHLNLKWLASQVAKYRQIANELSGGAK